MAISVMNWVLEEAPDLPPHCFGVLMALASKAREDGTAAYAGQQWLAIRTRKSDRSVRADLATLEEAKLIRRGDQSIVAHIPADEQPVVWDLAIERVGGLRERKQASARKSTAARNAKSSQSSAKDSDQHEQERERKPASARNSASARNWTSGGERKPASAYTSFDKSSSSPSEKKGTRTQARTTIEGAHLLAEHIAACRQRPSKDLLLQTSQKIDELLAEEHITADMVRAGLALLRAKPHLSPRLLSNLVFEAGNATPLQATGTDIRAPIRLGPLANVNDRDWSGWASGGPSGGNRR